MRNSLQFLGAIQLHEVFCSKTVASSKLVGSSIPASDSRAWADSLSAVDNAVDPTSLKDKEVDSLIEADALSDVEKLVDPETELDSEDWVEVFPKTTTIYFC